MKQMFSCYLAVLKTSDRWMSCCVIVLLPVNRVNFFYLILNFVVPSRSQGRPMKPMHLVDYCWEAAVHYLTISSAYLSTSPTAKHMKHNWVQFPNLKIIIIFQIHNFIVITNRRYMIYQSSATYIFEFEREVRNQNNSDFIVK